MKKYIFGLLVLCLLLSACSNFSVESEPETASQVQVTTDTMPEPEAVDSTDAQEQTGDSATVYPLPDATMENLNDSVLYVSLEEGDAYVDDTGKMQMDLTVYSYDKYDMVDISLLKAGDILVTHTGEVEIVSLDRREDGSVAVNGGLYENGFDLVTDDSGIYYETGYNDAKNWYKIGDATIRVSTDFEYHDTSDLEAGEVVYYPGSFLVGEVTNYDFTPYNTTVRVENGQIMEMHRVYVP